MKKKKKRKYQLNWNSIPNVFSFHSPPPARYSGKCFFHDSPSSWYLLFKFFKDSQKFFPSDFFFFEFQNSFRRRDHEMTAYRRFSCNDILRLDLVPRSSQVMISSFISLIILCEFLSEIFPWRRFIEMELIILFLSFFNW